MSRRITLLLTNGFDPDVRVYKEALYLVGRGFSVTVLCWDRGTARGYPQRETLEGIEIVRFRVPSVAGSGMKQLPAFLAYIRSCRAWLKDHPCDYFHCNDIDGAITWYLAKNSPKTPMVFDMHEFYETGGAGMRLVWRKLTLFFLKRAAAGLYENDVYLNEDYRSVREKLYPLKNYPDTDLIQYRPKSPCGVFRIGYHGAVRKQIPAFTALFEAVRDMEDVRVDIHGGGTDLSKLLELEKRYPNVHVHGPFNGATELTGLYEETDLLYCGYDPKDPNMQGLAEIVKYFEAILTGTPILATESLAVGRRTREHGFGLACDTLDPEAIRAAVLKLKDDRAFWQQCADNERAQASQYDWKQAVQILDQVYQS